MTDKLENYYKDYEYGKRKPMNMDELTERESELLVESNIFCTLPWIHLHAFPDGRAYPCCMADMEQEVGSMREDTMEDIFHGEKMNKIRANMQKEKPCSECRKCYEQERSGFFSVRNSANKTFGHNLRDIELHEDGSVDEFKLRYYDVRFSNLCNLSCRTCGDIFSSNWVKYSKMNNWLPKDAPNVTHAGRYETDAWEQLLPHIPYLQEVYFAGGEPLLMDEHYRLLKELLRQGRNDVKLVYNTNFTELNFKGESVLPLWNEFDEVGIGASLDASHGRGEVMRTGSKWNQIVKNREEMLRTCPTVDFYVSSTLSVMNSFHVPDFHKEWVELGLIRAMDWNINILQGPEWYRIDILPPEMKKDVVAKYEEHIEWLKDKDSLDRASVGYKSAIHFIQDKDNMHLIPQFLAKTKHNDGMFKKSFWETFPELIRLQAYGQK